MSTAVAQAIRPPDRTTKARAAALISLRAAALDAYAVITPFCLQLRSQGHTLDYIAKALNERGLKTRGGKPFMRPSVSRIIARSQEAGAR